MAAAKIGNDFNREKAIKSISKNTDFKIILKWAVSDLTRKSLCSNSIKKHFINIEN